MNSYSGAMNVNAGTLETDVANALSTVADVTLASGTNFNLRGFNQTIGSLSGAGNVNLGVMPDNLTTGADNASTAYSGIISGAGALTKAGFGYFFLTGSNTYTGGTTVSSGALVVGFNGTTGSITGNVVDNALLYFDRADQYTFGGVISGSGTLVQSASGVTILTANNAFSGGTVIQAGTLQLGNGGTTGAITGNVANSSTLAFDRSDSNTFGGVISGTGSVLQAGSGTTILTSDNTYTGGTTIAAGTLQLGNGGTSGLISGAVTDNGTLNFDRSDGVAYSDQISGTGSLTQAGTGYLYLTGANTYSGGTTISSGALLIGNGGKTGSITGNVVNNGLFYFNRSNAFGVTGTISGSGRVVQTNTGQVTLSGTNTYSGGTVVNATGPIEAAASSAFGSGHVQLIAAGATLILDNGVNLANEVDINASSFIDVNGSDSATISGALVGSNPFEKDGTGTLTLNHDNSATYSGNISFHGHLVAGVTGAFGTGTVTDLGSVIQLLDGVTDATATNLVDDLQIIQDGGTATISGVISQTGGPWGVTKTGVGTLFLTAANTYTGGTFVDAGTLVVNGSVAGSLVTVNATGTLKGTGTIGSLSVASAGTVAPGNSIGTLHVAGNVGFGANSVYQVETNAAGLSDLIAAGGTATLSGGIVEVLAQPGAYAPVTNYTILTAAGGVTGTFAGTTSNTVMISPSLSYKPGEVDLTLTFHSLASFAGTANQANVASAIQGNFTGSLFTAVDALAPGQLPAAYDASSGEIHASVRSALLENNTTLRQTVLARLHDADASGSSFWAHPFGNWGAIDGDGNAARLNTNFSGITVGADTAVADGLRLGLDGGYGQVQGFAQQRGSSLTSDSIHAGVYGGYDDGAFTLKAGVLGSWGNVRTTRVVLFPGFLDKDSAKQSARTTQAFAEAAYDFGLEGIDLAPFINGGWSEASTGAFSETGGAAALSGLHASSDTTFMTLGTRLSTDLQLANGADILPNLTVGWQHAFHGLTPSRLLTFEATGQSFTVLGVPLDQDEAVIDAGFAFHPIPALSVNVGYNAILSQRVSDNGVHANLSWDF